MRSQLRASRKLAKRPFFPLLERHFFGGLAIEVPAYSP
jgi:hypothetical protein